MLKQDIATPWITARQASLSITSSRSLLKLMPIESVMPSSHLILCRPLLSCPQSLPASGSIPVSQLFASGGQSIGVSVSASVLPMNTQDRSPLDLLKESNDIIETLRFLTWISETEAAEIVEKHTVYDIKFFDECHTAGKWWSRCRCLCVWLLFVCWPGLPPSTYILYFFAFHFFCDYHHHPL